MNEWYPIILVGGIIGLFALLFSLVGVIRHIRLIGVIGIIWRIRFARFIGRIGVVRLIGYIRLVGIVGRIRLVRLNGRIGIIRLIGYIRCLFADSSRSQPKRFKFSTPFIQNLHLIPCVQIRVEHLSISISLKFLISAAVLCADNFQTVVFHIAAVTNTKRDKEFRLCVVLHIELIRVNVRLGRLFGLRNVTTIATRYKV